MVSFAQIFLKQALKGTNFFNLKKGQKMANWPNHFISSKQFQKRPILADLATLQTTFQTLFLKANNGQAESKIKV